MMENTRSDLVEFTDHFFACAVCFEIVDDPALMDCDGEHLLCFDCYVRCVGSTDEIVSRCPVCRGGAGEARTSPRLQRQVEWLRKKIGGEKQEKEEKEEKEFASKEFFSLLPRIMELLKQPMDPDDSFQMAQGRWTMPSWVATYAWNRDVLVEERTKNIVVSERDRRWKLPDTEQTPSSRRRARVVERENELQRTYENRESNQNVRGSELMGMIMERALPPDFVDIVGGVTPGLDGVMETYMYDSNSLRDSMAEPLGFSDIMGILNHGRMPTRRETTTSRRGDSLLSTVMRLASELNREVDESSASNSSNASNARDDENESMESDGTNEENEFERANL